MFFDPDGCRPERNRHAGDTKHAPGLGSSCMPRPLARCMRKEGGGIVHAMWHVAHAHAHGIVHALPPQCGMSHTHTHVCVSCVHPQNHAFRLSSERVRVHTCMRARVCVHVCAHVHARAHVHGAMLPSAPGSTPPQAPCAPYSTTTLTLKLRHFSARREASTLF